MIVASCHCQAVRIEVPAPPEYLNECQCSVCRRYGVAWGYYQREQVRIASAPATEFYAYGEKNLEFHRCRVCGCVTHWLDTDPAGRRMAVNGRLLAPEDVAAVPVKRPPGPP